MSLLLKDRRASVDNFVSELGTRNLLFTSSCRAALFLAYRALGLKGKVIVSPLTCDDAIIPILAAGLRPEFADVCPLTFNLCPTSVRQHINGESVAIQSIYLGGNPSGASVLYRIASENGLVFIEDCAHALGARDQGHRVGTLGDVGCFNFTKSIYGAGGALIGRTPQFIEKAIEFQQKWHPTSMVLVGYRFMRSLLSSFKCRLLGEYGYAILTQVASKFALSNRCVGPDRIFDEVSRPRRIEMGWAVYQLPKRQKTVEARRIAAEVLTSVLRARVSGVQYQLHFNRAEGVYTRYLLRVPVKTLQVNRTLREKGIDAKHLVQRHGALYQERFDKVEWLKPYIQIAELPNYQKLHDNLSMLPLYVGLSKQEAKTIADALAYSLRGAAKPAYERLSFACVEKCDIAGGKRYDECFI